MKKIIESIIKNYKALRHKGNSRYRKSKLENIHPSNIKKPLKFTDNIDDTADDTTN